MNVSKSGMLRVSSVTLCPERQRHSLINGFHFVHPKIRSSPILRKVERDDHGCIVHRSITVDLICPGLSGEIYSLLGLALRTMPGYRFVTPFELLSVYHWESSLSAVRLAQRAIITGQCVLYPVPLDEYPNIGYVPAGFELMPLSIFEDKTVPADSFFALTRCVIDIDHGTFDQVVESLDPSLL